ncbi:MAG TPA: PTS sugar transporter subunit IIA [Thermodesulfobacteriota bacterium]|nr:PTS sugar transporter subunit IIA [Thermodesulfobacteriota bacterium]
MIKKSQRGKLKIYVGYSAGVGKTYEMLLEGRRLRKDGIDVVIGLVETHGRKETEALVEGLEIIPRRKINYRGIEIGEMDLEAILARRPEVVLVDELAHTNVPGSRNAKRYQDVEEILSAGIHVISTLNVQHLESLYETIERATGVRVRERIPDRIVAEADQLVNVDVTTEDLRQRLVEGKVYTKESADAALEHFFRQTNLEQLRELTLRELAAQIDWRRREALDEETASSPDQVMVCLSSRGPNSEALLRYTSRLAGRLNRNWYAVYVQTSGERPTQIDAETQRLLSNTLELAQQLGATVFTYRGDDIVKTILQFAKEYRVGHIVVGSTRGKYPLWRRLLGQKSIVERLITESEGITVVVLDTSAIREDGTYRPSEDRPLETETERESEAQKALSPLSGMKIVIWKDSMEKEKAMRELLETLCRDLPAIKEPAWTALIEREKQGGTFAGEDILMPHARVTGIERPLLALGVGKAGIKDSDTGRTAHIMFLMLSPAEESATHVEVLGAVAGLCRDSQLFRSIIASETPSQIEEIIKTWQYGV